jgi:hypothetical protein
MRSSKRLTTKSPENSPTEPQKLSDEEKQQHLAYLKKSIEKEESRTSQVIR